MAENYSLNSKFGLNVTPNKQQKQIAPNEIIKSTQESIGNIFDTVTGYVQKYENVFSGDVEREINLYDRQAMIVGMNLRAAEVKRHFDMNI